MTLAEQQEAIEQGGLSDGEKRYAARCAKAYAAGAATGAPPVRHFLEACVEWLEADLTLKMEELDPGDGPGLPGPLPRWAQWVARVGESTAAYLTLKAALNGIAPHPESQAIERPLRRVAVSLMGMLVDEHRANIFIEKDTAAFANAIQHNASTKLIRSRRVKKRMKFHGIEVPPDPGARETLDVGAHLLMAMCDSTGAFEIREVRDYTKKRYRTTLALIPSPATLEWISTRSDRLRLTMPVHPPCVMPPKDWKPGEMGGYHFALSNSLPLVRHCSTPQSTKLSAAPMPLVYSALNALQRTAWRVNQSVLDVVKLALDGKVSAAIPGPVDDLVPDKPLDPSTHRSWRIAAADIHARNSQRRIRRGDAERAMVVAMQVRSLPEFYYPYSLDFRGRAYPAVEFLHPHGPDVVRGLLEFAEGIPLTRKGAGWLAVHGANTLGISVDGGIPLSKRNFQERVDAIKAYTPRILAIAEDPLATQQEWTQADEPWQFLAFCMEWSQWTRTGSLETHLPVGLDGTANGLQHFSAMLRDPGAAATVNMTLTNRPSDLYATVAEKVTTKLMASSDPLAALWLGSGLVTRSLVKRPVMTLAYGATRYGFVDQILSTMRADATTWQTARRIFGLAHVRIRPSVQFLSSILWDVLSDAVGGALSAMSWLQQAANQVALHTGGPIPWTVPLTGFPAHMEYWKQRRSRIQTRMNGTILSPSVWTATNKVDRQKTTNAIAPNIVHSLDAAAMMATTVACAARGVPAFSMIHDSYACHAEYIPVLADALRTSFIDLYFDREVLVDLQREWSSTGADIPDPPSMGVFDVREVRHAPFFFA